MATGNAAAPEPAVTLGRGDRSRAMTWIWAAIAVAGAAAAALSLRAGRTTPAPPVLGQIPAFSLLDETGRPFTLSELSGRVWVADFIFTQCAGSCPAMTARMARLRGEVEPEVVLVSFTVDPRHDTPAVLAAYARSTGASGDWRFVTGRQAELYQLATGGFRLAALEVPADQREAGGDGPFLHSSKLVLVDRQARIRGYYDSTDAAAMKALVADVEAVGREAT